MTALEINTEQFEEITAQESPVLVDFWAPWCGYCRRIAPAFEQLAEKYADSLTAVKVNIDSEPQLAREEGIEVIPTLAIYRSGELLDKLVGADSRASIDEFIRSTLGL